MTTTFDFKDSNVFVFGGTSGINLGIARCFASAGANVAVASRSQEKVDAAVADRLREAHPDAPVFPAGPALASLALLIGLSAAGWWLARLMPTA